ncbi:MAG: hypothetical protein JO100_04160 [Pseudonocardia sp.]|nr:hypothetical protein [Pseudonocardia sp.]
MKHAPAIPEEGSVGASGDLVPLSLRGGGPHGHARGSGRGRPETSSAGGRGAHHRGVRGHHRTVRPLRARDRQTASVIHLLALCQAADLRGPHRLGRTRELHRRVRALVPAPRRDRAMDADIDTALTALRAGNLLDPASP